MSRTLVLAVAAALSLSACAKPAATPPSDAAAEPEAVPTRTGVVHRDDTPYTLVGPELKVGDRGPPWPCATRSWAT